jgi:hypothetical protein
MMEGSYSPLNHGFAVFPRSSSIVKVVYLKIAQRIHTITPKTINVSCCVLFGATSDNQPDKVSTRLSHFGLLSIKLKITLYQNGNVITKKKETIGSTIKINLKVSIRKTPLSIHYVSSYQMYQEFYLLLPLTLLECKNLHLHLALANCFLPLFLIGVDIPNIV